MSPLKSGGVKASPKVGSPMVDIERCMSNEPDQRFKMLQIIVDAIASNLSTQTISPSAADACKLIVRTLETSSRSVARRKVPSLLHCASLVELALWTVDSHHPLSGAISGFLTMFGHELDWYRSNTGDYASLNFESRHAHALIMGPGGFEEQANVVIGITVMEPYTRFPDHAHTRDLLVFPLSGGEFKAGEGPWDAAGLGSMVFCKAGDICAMRCAANPLLTLWVQTFASLGGRIRVPSFLAHLELSEEYHGPPSKFA